MSCWNVELVTKSSTLGFDRNHLRGAARALVEADAVAPAEVRCRPLARTVIAALARSHPAPAGVARLATLVGLTR